MWPFKKAKACQDTALCEIQTGVINMDLTSSNIKHKLLQAQRLAKALDDIEEGSKLNITLPDTYENVTVIKKCGKIDIKV